MKLFSSSNNSWQGTQNESVLKGWLSPLKLSLGLLPAVLVSFLWTDPVFSKQPKCMKVDKPHLLKCKGKDCVLRDQFDPDNLLSISQKLVHDYFSGVQGCKVTMPSWAWTGYEPIPTRENLPVEQVDISSLTADQLAEKIISLSGLMMYAIDPAVRSSVLSTDLLNIKPFERGRDKYTRGMGDLMQLLADKNASGEITLDESHGLAVLIGSSHMKSYTNFYANELYAFQQGWEQQYSTVLHRYYNQLQNSDSSWYGSLSAGDWTIFNIWLNSDPADLGYTDDNLKAMTQAYISDKLKLEKMLKWEQEAVGNYFWPRVFVDPLNAMVFSANGVDPDGYAKPEGLTAEIFDTVPQFEWLSQRNVPFTELHVDYPIGGTYLSFNGIPAEGVVGLEDIINTIASSPDVANQTINDISKIWNESIAPIYGQLYDLALIRQAESHNDYYMGSWRAGVQHVKQVNRDADGLAVSFVAVVPGKGEVTVPINAPLSNDPVVKKLQQRVAEMDKWFNDNLEMAQDLHTGDTFNLLEKSVKTKGLSNLGVCDGRDLSTSRYGSIQDIIDNYTTQTKIVNVDEPLADLIYKSGFAVAEFLYDVREFLADAYAADSVNNGNPFNFADTASAGVCKTNLDAHQVPYAEVRNYIQDQQFGGFDTSDVAVLGRHYGYDVNGNQIPAEWNNGELVYNFSVDGKQFDYVYRQHYAVTPNVALTPSNLSDTTSAMPNEELYQYTDPADSARRTQFVSDFNALETTQATETLADKRGTYYRWKMDWITQKLSGYVISSAESKKLLSANFLDSYFRTTFDDTNDNGNLCGFGLQKTAAETIRFRMKGSLRGGGFSQSDSDKGTGTFTTIITMNSGNPAANPKIRNQMGILIHEGALGHGFDSVPNQIDFFRDVQSPISWFTIANTNGIVIPGNEWWYSIVGPGTGTLFEGWATYGELQGSLKQLIPEFDNNGCPIPGSFDRVASFLGLVDLSRIGARQVVSVAENTSKYAWSFYHSVKEFTDLSDIPLSADSVGYHQRFIGHPTQQTVYAAGLVTNLGILSRLKAEASAMGGSCEVNEAAYNEFRITRTDYILGAPLSELVNENINDLITCP